MLSNYEKVYKKVLPAVRQAAAKRMMLEGITQQRAASLLGITQAGISKALSRQSVNIKMDQKHMDALTRGLIENKDHDAQRAICSICQDNVKFKCTLMVS